MKQQIKTLNILITIVLCIVALLSLTNVTYSYFTANAQITNEKNGQVNDKFDNLDVKFAYKKDNQNIEVATTNSIVLYSAGGPIQREVAFEFALTQGGKAIYSLSIINTDGCDCYVRFWIDAYVVKNGVADKTENYGKYFFLDDSAIDPETEEKVFTREGGSLGNNSWCYFFTGALPSNLSDGRLIGNTLRLDDVSATDEVPVDLLGEELQITISLEAVQAANDAYLYVFGKTDDTMGYYTGWGETE